jgi:thiol-disulfide isomerase/thioredoxin
MKKLILALCLFVISVSAFAAEIKFLENPEWASVLAKAKQEKKMIFLDGYATWCGPCKKMDEETYKDQAVADYFNANFINVKYDMEKGEGKTLSEKYLVTAYPNLMFINADGVMLHKGVGFLEAAEFVGLGKEAKDPASQYYTLKKNALQLSTAQFAKFAEMATSFEDEDFDQLGQDYLAKQADILGNADLISLIMTSIDILPNENALAYFAKSEAKITDAGKYTNAEFQERLIGLAIDYAISEHVQKDQSNIDFVALKNILDKYIPTDKAFFVYHYFKAQYALDNEKIDEGATELEFIIANTPAKVTLDQISNAMMNMGPDLLEKGKLAAVLQKFDAIKLTGNDASKAYMKEFVKAIIYIKVKDFTKFETIAKAMIASSATPQSVKDDLQSALDRMKQQ